MSQFHSTVSRREFMKGLGITGAGLGLVSLASPVFHDFDEMISASPSVHKWPWWVKELEYDNTTVDIDWGKVTRADFRHVNQCSWQGKKEGEAWINLRDGAGTADRLYAENAQRREQGLKSNDPFYDLRNRALTGVLFSAGLGFNAYSPDGFIGPKVTTPEDLKVPKWTGTAEEASILLRQVCVLLGASDISIVELNPATSRNMIHSHEFHDGKPYVFEDVDQAYFTGTVTTAKASNNDGKRVIPNKCRWVVQYNFDESHTWLGRFAEEGGLRYPEGRQIQLRIQAFLHGLGYQAIGPLDYTNNLSENVGMAILGGTAELGRNNLAISPRFGAVHGECSSIITDLQLAPTKPIDAGIHRFCNTCMKCAELCPGGALSRQGDPMGEIIKEPSWEPIGPWQRWPNRSEFESKTPQVFRQEPGINEPAFYSHWWYSMPDCRPMYDICGTWGCGVNCPFKGKGEASVHELVLTTTKFTPIFNSFFRAMDDTMGYGQEKMKEPDYINAFWEGKVELPRFGTETSTTWR